MRQKLIFAMAFIGIILIATVARFIGVSWDQGTHLHPDERFLTMVGTAVHIPKSFALYIDPRLSSLNPANVNFPFFVYGLFPITLNKIAAVWLRNDTYELFTLQGRMLSAVFDIFALLYVFKLGDFFERKYHLDQKIKFAAAFVYAIMVLPIQLAHFFAVDTFLNAFTLASVYYALWAGAEIHHKKEIHTELVYIVMSAVLFGLALASKITAIYIVPLALLLLSWNDLKEMRIRKILTRVLIWGIVIYVTVRIANPYMFETSNIFNPQISNLFIKNLKELKASEDPNGFFPPAIQWIHTQPIIYSLYNIAFFGLGIPLFFLSLLGAVLMIQKKRYLLWVIAVWMSIFFVYQSAQFGKPLRYMLFLCPYLALFAGRALAEIQKRFGASATIGVTGIILIWPLAFMSIYFHPHSRVEASQWIYSHIAPGKTIAVEHWDDALPLSLVTQSSQLYKYVELPVFEPDSDPAKWEDINPKLRSADYYVLSSNRAWRSIMNAPEKYPVQSKFYRDLFDGKYIYKKVAGFVPDPTLRYLGIPISFSEATADESFTVYDHPTVYIFKKSESLQ